MTPLAWLFVIGAVTAFVVFILFWMKLEIEELVEFYVDRRMEMFRRGELRGYSYFDTPTVAPLPPSWFPGTGMSKTQLLNELTDDMGGSIDDLASGNHRWK